MIKVKDVNASATKFVQRAQSAAPDYTAGVSNAGPAWAANSAAAVDTWGTAVQAAVADGRFVRGINKAGPQKYQTRASTVGAQRYPSGVAAAGPSWATGTGPYLTAISNFTLPPRRPTGDPGNLQRVGALNTMLRTLKMQS
jgi:hypothetical protein